MSNHSRPSGESVVPLPERANLDHLKSEAKSLLRDLRKVDPSAQLATAQLIVARKYGFSSWRNLKVQFAERVATLDIDQSAHAIKQRRYEQFRPRKAVAIDTKLLDAFTGHYQLQPRYILSINRVGDTLYSQLTGQRPVQLFPESERKFFFNDIPGGGIIPGQMTFIMDANGKANELILHQSGHNTPSRRISDAEAAAVTELLKQRIKDNKPLPGSEPALYRFIQSELSGKPDYGQMTRAMALARAAQSPMVQEELAGLGEFQFLKFKGVDRHGTDVFEAVFADGSTEWRIRLGQDEKIVGLFFRHLP